jgi:hypothetical protein
VNGALLAIFVLANSPLITSYWLAKNVMKLDMDHWATQLFVAALGFGLYYPIITILMRLFL